MLNKTLSEFVIAVILSFTFYNDFLNEQKQHEKVRAAIKEKYFHLDKLLAKNSISLDSLNILIVAYKDADLLEVFAKSKSNLSYKKIISYPICSRSGQLGPKRKYGDFQVPEGFYHIDRFNPQSNFYLSLGINYPNMSDRRKSKHSNLGGDIFIHGSCVTIGCLPLTDDFIKEIYLLAVYAKNCGQSKIPVYIFPFEMNQTNMKLYSVKYRDDKELLSFWRNLKQGYDTFQNGQSELKFKIAENGDYVF